MNEHPREKNHSFITGAISIDVALAFVFGVVFIVIMLCFASFKPNPTPFSSTIFIVVLALAAAGVGAMLPGTIEIRYRKTLRAAGGFAMFCVVLAFSRPIQHAATQFIDPPQPEGPVASAYLAVVDAGDIGAAWNLLDPVAHDAVAGTKTNFLNAYKYRTELGHVEKRELTGVNTLQSPPGYPIGLYRGLTFRTKFSSSSDCQVETITLRATETLKWNVFAHQISPITIRC